LVATGHIQYPSLITGKMTPPVSEQSVDKLISNILDENDERRAARGNYQLNFDSTYSSSTVERPEGVEWILCRWVATLLLYYFYKTYYVLQLEQPPTEPFLVSVPHLRRFQWVGETLESDTVIAHLGTLA
jgi:hypothetical protein